MKRVGWLLAAAMSLVLPAQARAQGEPGGKPNGNGAAKTLRYAFPIAETSFDPAYVSDQYSRTVIAGIFEAPLEFEYLARPFRMRPNTAAEMQQAVRLLVAYMPLKIMRHRIGTDLAHPWLIGFDRNPFMREFFKYVDIDPARRRGVKEHAP